MKSSVPPTPASPTFTTVTASDLEVDSGTLSVDETNNRVGIATQSPAKTLSVDGDLHFQPTSISTGHITAAGSLDIRATDNLKIGTDGADSIRIGRDNSSACKVHIRSGSDADLVVTDGKVGIGMEDPTDALEIDGDIQLTPTATSTAHLKTTGSLDIRATDNLKIGTDGADSIRIGRDNSSACKVHIRSGSDADLVVTDGKVGIANDAPSTTLDVTGDGRFTTDLTVGGSVTTTGITMAPANATTAIAIDHDFTSTDASTVVGLDIDIDKTGATTTTNTIYGIRCDIDNTQATNGTNTVIGGSFTPTCQHAAAAGTVMVKGLEVVATSDPPGVSTARGIEVTAQGGDYNQSFYSKCENGGIDIKMVSSTDSGDFCTIAVGANGATEIITVDDNAAAADLTMSIDGDFTVSAVTANTIHDYNTTTFENQLTSGQGGGEILKYSPGADDTLTVGGLYFLHSDGTWDQTDADAVATGATQMLGIGLGNARTAGVLLKGYIRIPSTEILNTPGSGAVDGLPLYVSTTAGHLDFTQPSGSGDYSRIVGFAIDDDGGDVLIRFDPDSTHVEIA